VAGQSWLADTFAGIMIITATYCICRMVVARRHHRPTEYQVDGVHVLMGIAMTGMLVPRLRVFWAGGWEAVFGAAAVWFAWQAIRERHAWPAAGRTSAHHFQHLLGCTAMLYMLLAVTSVTAAAGESGMGGMTGGAAHFPTLALVFAFSLFGYVVWTADRIPGMATVAASEARRVPARVSLPAAAPAVPAVAGQASRRTTQAPSREGSAVPVSPRLAAGCEIAIGVTMDYMLILTL
jgi:hypothetical protein